MFNCGNVVGTLWERCGNIVGIFLEKNKIEYNNLLKSCIDFVCKSTTVLPEDFATLALLNLLDERLNWIKNTSKESTDSAYHQELLRHYKTINELRLDANVAVLHKNQKNFE
jgi:hypothetical protein